MKTEYCLWRSALEEVLMTYEPFSDTEGQKFWIDWLDLLLDLYRAEPGECGCRSLDLLEVQSP